ncbi:MAG TPA: hypothetical protein VN457_07755, partial [Chlamydiales bacterium]|nr:hypothetical protein [Chlamydiales bacterium]
IFPEGLLVAYIHSVAPLAEGAFSYSLEAQPAATEISNLRTVIVLPPQGADHLNLPTLTEKIAKQLEH